MKWLLQIVLAFCIFCGASFSGSAQAATNVWALQLPVSRCSSSPALAPDGTIYLGIFDGEFLAVTPDGKIKWIFHTGREIKSSPAVATDGTIYFGSRDWKLYAVMPNGKLKWTFPTGAWVDSSPAIAADGTIYFGSWDTNFYALNPNGSLKWKFPTSGIIDSSPAIGADGTIYFGSHDKNFYALSPDGRLRWKFPTQGQIISSPAIAADGTIYFSSDDGNLYSLNPDGSEKWRLRTGGVTWSSPVLDTDGNLYLSVNGEDISVSKDGKKRWERYYAAWIDSTPAVAAGNVIYFSAPWRNLIAVAQNNHQQWLLNTDSHGDHGNITSSPVIGGGGTIYVANQFYLCAINATNGLPPLAKSSWPMFRANPQHTGRVQAQ